MGIRPCKNKAIQYALNRTRNAQLSERIFFLCRKRRDKNKTPAKNRPTFERTKSEQRKNSFLWNQAYTQAYKSLYTLPCKYSHSNSQSKQKQKNNCIQYRNTPFIAREKNSNRTSKSTHSCTSLCGCIHVQCYQRSRLYSHWR